MSETIGEQISDINRGDIIDIPEMAGAYPSTRFQVRGAINGFLGLEPMGVPTTVYLPLDETRFTIKHDCEDDS